MMEQRELEFATRVWEEIRASLVLCGDIGDFHPDYFELEDMPRVMWKERPVLPLSIIRREMELGGAINEVYWNVYEAISIAAALRLGFTGDLAVAFGDALTCLRTGIVAGHGTLAEQCIAQDIFMTRVEYGTPWDTDYEPIRSQLREIYLRFKAWEADPEAHKREREEFWSSRAPGS